MMDGVTALALRANANQHAQTSKNLCFILNEFGAWRGKLKEGNADDSQVFLLPIANACLRDTRDWTFGCRRRCRICQPNMRAAYPIRKQNQFEAGKTQGRGA